MKQTIRTFVHFNNRTFECGKYAFVPALVESDDCDDGSNQYSHESEGGMNMKMKMMMKMM